MLGACMADLWSGRAGTACCTPQVVLAVRCCACRSLQSLAIASGHLPAPVGFEKIAHMPVLHPAIHFIAETCTFPCLTLPVVLALATFKAACTGLLYTQPPISLPLASAVRRALVQWLLSIANALLLAQLVERHAQQHASSSSVRTHAPLGKELLTGAQSNSGEGTSLASSKPDKTQHPQSSSQRQNHAAAAVEGSAVAVAPAPAPSGGNVQLPEAFPAPSAAHRGHTSQIQTLQVGMV